MKLCVSSATEINCFSKEYTERILWHLCWNFGCR